MTLIHKPQINPSDKRPAILSGSKQPILRCQGITCLKALGVVLPDGRLEIKSTGSNWKIIVRLDEGEVECEKCNTIVKWKIKKFN